MNQSVINYIFIRLFFYNDLEIFLFTDEFIEGPRPFYYQDT